MYFLVLIICSFHSFSPEGAENSFADFYKEIKGFSEIPSVFSSNYSLGQEIGGKILGDFKLDPQGTFDQVTLQASVRKDSQSL